MCQRSYATRCLARSKNIWSCEKAKGRSHEDVLRAFHEFRSSEGPFALDELNLSLQKAHGFEDVSGADILGVSFSGGEVTMGFGKGDPTVRQAWVGKLSLPDAADNSKWTAADTPHTSSPHHTHCVA